MTPGGRKGTGEETCDPSSALMTWRQDEQTASRPPTFENLHRFSGGIADRRFSLVGVGGHTRSIVQEGQAAPPPSIRFRTVLFAAKAPLMVSTQTNRTKGGGRKATLDRMKHALRAHQIASCVCVRERETVCVHVCMGPRSRAALGAQSRIGVFLPSRVFAAHAWME